MANDPKQPHPERLDEAESLKLQNLALSQRLLEVQNECLRLQLQAIERERSAVLGAIRQRYGADATIDFDTGTITYPPSKEPPSCGT